METLIQSLHYACVLIPDHFPDLVTLLEIGHEQRKAQENNRRGGEIEPDTAPRDDKEERHDAQGPDRAKADESRRSRAWPAEAMAASRESIMSAGCLFVVAAAVELKPEAKNEKRPQDRGDGCQ